MRTETSDRLISGIGAIAVTAALGALLVAGLAVGPARIGAAALTLIDVAPPPPPPAPRPPPPVHGFRAAKAAGAPAPRARATSVVVPPPIVPLPVPPVVAAVRPAVGAVAASGASSRGAGTGAGGEGDGPGGGGGEGGEGDDTPPKPLYDRLGFADLGPHGRDATHWLLWVSYDVEVDGRVRRCAVSRSSGDPAVDDSVCAAIIRKWRFRPAFDGDGRPFVAHMTEYREWTVERERGDE